MDPPEFLIRLLQAACGTDNWVHRRCRRHLPTVWAGLADYVGRTLRSPRDWEDVVTPAVMQRFYHFWCRKCAPDAMQRRWVRYTLNRLAEPTAPRVRDQCGARDRYVGLRITHQQEAVVQSLLQRFAASLPAKVLAGHRYVLRRFVVGGPYYTADAVRRVCQAEVEWWLRERQAQVVPRVRHGAFALRLWSALRLVGPVPNAGVPEVRRTSTPLLLSPHGFVGGDPADDIPEACQVFFRHYFESDAVEYVRGVQSTLRAERHGSVHARQLWDGLRHLWQYVTDDTPGRPLDERPLRESPPELVWRWLLAVYRRHGGGDPHVLPSVCMRALNAARLAMAHAGGGAALDRGEYLSRIHRAALVEEPLGLKRVPRRIGPTGSTYTAEECARLLATCDGPRDRFLMLLLQRVGLRNAALRRLAWRDVVEEAAPHAVRTVGTAHEKGGCVRSFVLGGDATLCAAAEAHLRDTLAAATGWRWDTACVFPHHLAEPDRPMSPGQIHYWFGRLAARAEVRGAHVTLHHFRHLRVPSCMICVCVCVFTREKKPRRFTLPTLSPVSWRCERTVPWTLRSSRRRVPKGKFSERPVSHRTSQRGYHHPMVLARGSAGSSQSPRHSVVTMKERLVLDFFFLCLFLCLFVASFSRERTCR